MPSCVFHLVSCPSCRWGACFRDGRQSSHLEGLGRRMAAGQVQTGPREVAPQAGTKDLWRHPWWTAIGTTIRPASVPGAIEIVYGASQRFQV